MNSTSSFFSDLEKILGNVYTSIFMISTGVAAVALIIALMVIMLSSSQRSTETAKSWAKRIIIVWLAINLLGYGFDIMNEVTQDGNHSTWTEITE